MENVPYYDQLIRLASYQQQLGRPVRFLFQVASEGEQGSLTLVNPVPEEIQASDAQSTLPLFVYPNPDPLQAWARLGYVLLLQGKIIHGQGTFLLTTRTILLTDG